MPSYQAVLSVLGKTDCQLRTASVAGTERGSNRHYFFFGFLAWARSDAMGPRSFFGVFGPLKSLPAWDATFFEVGTLNAPLRLAGYHSISAEHDY